jgi:hypothetical protein
LTSSKTPAPHATGVFAYSNEFFCGERALVRLLHSQGEAETPPPTNLAMPKLCAILSRSIREIVARWEQSVDRAPWSALSRDDRLDELPIFLERLLDSTICGGRETRDPRRMLDVATAHGEQRRRVGLDYDHVMEESALLRRAVWEFAQSHRDEYHEMVRVDSGLTFALLASLHGYAKLELDARGEWDATFSRLISDWSSLLRN